jgi:para-aminobenzoate synthetase/4-amino-4-deoxychorismate lyase
MKASAEYFGFSFREKEILDELARVCAQRRSGKWKVRLLVSRQGETHIETQELDSLDRVLRVALAREPVNINDRFLFHKTTNRKVYEDALASRPDCDDVILWNDSGEVTESTIANLVVSIDDTLYTPPVHAGLLPGTLRAQLLEEGRIVERSIRRADLLAADEIFLLNSVRGWRPAVLVS